MSERAQLTYPFFSDLCLVPVCRSISSLFPLYIKQLLHWSFGFWKKEDITACSYFMNDGLGFSYPNLDPSFMKYEYKIINTWWMSSHCQQTQRKRERFRCSLLGVRRLTRRSELRLRYHLASARDLYTDASRRRKLASWEAWTLSPLSE